MLVRMFDLNIMVLLDIRRQGSQGAFAEEQIDFFQRDAFGLLENEKDNWEGYEQVCNWENKVSKKKINYRQSECTY